MVPFDTLFLGLDWGRVSEQTTRLVREYKGDGEYLSVHHPDEPDARNDYPDAPSLMMMKAATGKIGEILFG